MQVRKAGDTRDLFVKPRVVLHRARSERVHAEVDRVIPRRDAREMPNDVDLAYFGYTVKIVIASQFGRQKIVDVCFLDVQLRQAITDATRLRALEDQRLVLCRM